MLIYFRMPAASELTQYLESVFEPQLEKVQRLLKDIVNDPSLSKPKPVEASADPEITVIATEGILEAIKPVVEDLYEAIQETRATRDALTKYISKLKGSDKTEGEEWEATSIATHDLDDLSAKAKALQREYALTVSSAKVERDKAKRQLRITTTSGTTSTGPPVASSFRLPQIDVPIFTGNLPDFQSFWDLFTTVADQVNGTDVQKFSYLMTRLRGEPYDLVKNLRLTSDNYKVAKKQLNDRYGNTSLVERTIRSNLFGLPTCRTREEVRDMFTKAQSYIMQLESLQGGATMMSADIHYFLEQRLPSFYLERLVLKKASRTDWNLQAFREVMPKLLDEDMEINQILQNRPSRKEPDAQRGGDKYKPKLALANVNQNAAAHEGPNRVNPNKIVSKQNKPERCLFCGRDHRAYRCPLPAKERVDVMLRENRCTLCLKKGHYASACSAEPCRNCQQRHHTFLCYKPYQYKSVATRMTTTNSTDHGANYKVLQGKTPEKETVLTSVSTSIPAQTIMMGKVVTAINPNSGKKLKAAVIIDVGSTESYISERLATKLQLPCGQASKATTSCSLWRDDSTH